MKSPLVQLLLLFGVMALYFATLPPTKAIVVQKVGIFANLDKGQKVSLKETAHGFEIGVVPDVDLAFTITEIGPDYIVLEDVAKVAETRIPMYSIKSIKTVKFKGK